MRGVAEPGVTITCVALGCSGRRIVGGDAHGALRCWDVSTGDALIDGPLHSRGIIDIACPDAADYALSAGHDRAIRMTNLGDCTSKVVLTLPGPAFSFRRLIARGSDKWVIARSFDKRVLRIWDIEHGHVIHEFRARAAEFGDETYLLRDGCLASCGRPGIELWSFENHAPLGRIEIDGPLTASAAHPDGARVIVGDARGMVRTIDAASRETTAVALDHGAAVARIAIDDAGRIAVTLDAQGGLCVRDVETMQTIATWTLDERPTSCAVTTTLPAQAIGYRVHPDAKRPGGLIAVGCASGRVVIVDCIAATL